jgi:hypothetical protein
MIKKVGVLFACAAFVGCASPAPAPATTPQPTAQPGPATGTPAPTAPAPAAAGDWETITHEGAGVMFDIPVAWDDMMDGEGMGLGSPDGEAYIVFMAVAADELEVAIDMVYEELASWVEDIQLGEAEDTEVNGLPGMLISGQGFVDGGPVLLGLMLVDTPSGQILMVVGVGQENISDANLGVIDQVISSIRSM